VRHVLATEPIQVAGTSTAPRKPRKKIRLPVAFSAFDIAVSQTRSELLEYSMQPEQQPGSVRVVRQLLHAAGERDRVGGHAAVRGATSLRPAVVHGDVLVADVLQAQQYEQAMVVISACSATFVASAFQLLYPSCGFWPRPLSARRRGGAPRPAAAAGTSSSQLRQRQQLRRLVLSSAFSRLPIRFLGSPLRSRLSGGRGSVPDYSARFRANASAQGKIAGEKKGSRGSALSIAIRRLRRLRCCAPCSQRCCFHPAPMRSW